MEDQMIRRSFNVFMVVSLLVLLVGSAFSQEFARNASLEIPVPDADLNTGGMGNMVTDVDLDEDGLTDVYLVSHNWNDSDGEMDFRLYKYENGASGWEVVWSATVDMWKTNTWPALTIADLDGDGKYELIGGPVNWPDAVENPNPDRLVVFESAGPGSDVMGVADGDNYKPNTTFTITSEDNVNLRPFKWVAADVDADNVKELIFCDRVANWSVGVLSVDNVPDNADGSETWTVECDGSTLGITGENKWDVAVLDSVIYLFDEVQCDRVKWSAASQSYELMTPQTSVLAGAGAWKSAQVADIDGNATREIIVGSWYSTPVDGHGIFIYEYDATGDSLKGTKVVDLSKWMAGDNYGVYGGVIGDVDADGKFDYVFGSRNSTPNAGIFCAEYQGGGWATPENWTVTIVDSLAADGGRWGVVGVANVDDDPNEEILYTSSVPAGGIFGTGPQPIFVVDNLREVPTGPWQLVDVNNYQYVGAFGDTTGSQHGVEVDADGNVWVGNYYGGISIYDGDGNLLQTINEAVVPATNGDSTITITNCRGLARDLDGNILYTKSSVLIKFASGSGEVLDWVKLPGSPCKPAVDDEGFIYIALVVGVSPVSVIDPTTFEITNQITLSPVASGYARGMEVTPDGLTLIPAALDGNPGHPLYVFESTDYANYPMTDSIRYDNKANGIFLNQTVTMDWDPWGNLWVSQDNAYGAGGDAQLVNALVMFDYEKMEYGYLWMPHPNVTATGLTGPRGAAWSNDGSALYVASWGAGFTMKFEKIDAIDNPELVVNEFKLAQNYPNPFNPKTTINFRIAKPGKVSLHVYNMLGQKVATLVNQNMPIGAFTVNFDGTRLASGQYIYELTSGDVKITKKMMLIK
jgi:sugar lactone lactonase YvrE